MGGSRGIGGLEGGLKRAGKPRPYEDRGIGRRGREDPAHTKTGGDGDE